MQKEKKKKKIFKGIDRAFDRTKCGAHCHTFFRMMAESWL